MTDRALITGAAKRLGRTVAEGLAADGWDLCLHYNGSRAEAEAVADACRARGVRVVTLQADLADAAAAAGLAARATAALGPLNLLINNASVFEHDTAETMTIESWNLNLDVNLRAPTLLCQAFASQLPEEAKGNIINFLDQRVARPGPSYFSYTISKCALWVATRMLAMALAPRIRVNGIGPGLTLPSGGQSEIEFMEAQARSLLGFGAAPTDIMQAIRYLLAAAPVTGQILYVDAGERFQANPLDAIE